MTTTQHNSEIFSKLPSNWSRELEKEFIFVKKEGFYLTSPEEAVKTHTLGVLIDIDTRVKKEIFNFVTRSLPKTLLPKLFGQPKSGYHLSIQTSKNTNGDIKRLINLTKAYLKHFKKVLGKILLIYPSDNSLLGVSTIDSNIITDMRFGLGEIFNSCGFTPRFDQKRDQKHFDFWAPMTWLSLVRPIKAFTQEEIDLTLNLPKKTFTDINFNKFVISLNDPFFTPLASKVLQEINLS